MAQLVRDVMTDSPVCLPEDTTLNEAARSMRDRNIGDVLVTKGEVICGMITDRDIVVRAVADGRDPKGTTIARIVSRDLVTVAPDDPIDTAIDLMRRHFIRRLPVCQDGRPVGVISIGDLAIERDPQSALADISNAPANG